MKSFYLKPYRFSLTIFDIFSTLTLDIACLAIIIGLVQKQNISGNYLKALK